MNIFNFNKYPKGVWKDKNGILRYPDGTPFEGMETTFQESLNDQKAIQVNLSKVQSKVEAIKRIKELSKLIAENQKIAHAEEINLLRNKFNITANELDSLLGKDGWIEYQDGKNVIFPKGLY